MLDRHHVTVLCAEYDPARSHGHLTWRVHDEIPVVEIVNNWVCDTFADTYRSPVIAARIEQVLNALQPDVVHVHNLLNLSFDLPAMARSRGIPVVATLHDYTLVCPSGGQRLHRAEGYVCHEIDTARCARCFRESPFYTQAALGPAAGAVARSGVLRRAVGGVRRWSPGLLQAAAGVARRASRFSLTEHDVAERQASARRVFEQVNLFVAPSPSIAAEFIRLGVDTSRIRVSDYGFRRLSTVARDTPGPRLRIGFVGTLVWHKGAHVLLDAVRRLPAEAYELSLYGDVNVFPDYVADLRRQAEGLPVRFMGGFAADDAARVYAQMDVLVVPSLWLENSPLVIHEAFMAGVPVVGARMGGIADLVSDGRNGRLYEATSAGELAAVLQAVVDTRSVLSDWARALPPVKSIEDDADAWEAIYRELCPIPRQSHGRRSYSSAR